MQEICKLNALPHTVLRSPHLLHTRSFIILPASTKSHSSLTRLTSKEYDDEEKKTQRERERAEKKLQTVTKEVDWRVAKVYVALADDDRDAQDEGLKGKAKSADREGIEYLAIERYLDDMEWEDNERNEGRDVSKTGLNKFPWGGFESEEKGTVLWSPTMEGEPSSNNSGLASAVGWFKKNVNF